MKEVYVIAAKTKMSPPADETHFYEPPGFWLPRQIDRVLVSCTFTWDQPRAEYLADCWKGGFPQAEVLIGGPAYGDQGGEFTPGRFLKKGVTITTRGCPGCLKPCLVPKREGPLRCLEIKPGWIVQDNNLLAAPREHVEAVLDMLEEQPHIVTFSGGLEAKRFIQQVGWLLPRLHRIKLGELWFSYDCEPDRGPALFTIKLLHETGHDRRQLRCYVLLGYEGDRVSQAEGRLEEVWEAGGLPFPQLWRGENATSRHEAEWAKLVRDWSRKEIVFAKHKEGSIA